MNITAYDKSGEINDLILQAKLGKRAAFDELKLMFKFLYDKVLSAFVETYRLPDHRKFEMAYESYFITWEIIKKFNFQQPFAFFLKEELIARYQEMVEKNWKYNPIDNEIIKSKIVRKKNKKRRKITKAMRALTGRQMEALYWCWYRNLTIDQCFETIGISKDSFIDRLRLAYPRFSQTYWGQKHKEKYAEKAYGIFEVRKKRREK